MKKEAHLTYNGHLLCEFGLAGTLLMFETGTTCDYLSTRAAHRAAKKIREARPRARVRIVEGACPTAKEAA